ncbi:hypothetical protein BLA6993_05022 [Burkholderia lata]|nr:hypothetical protein BLA6993_05022 [Burkholderia lata]
MLTLEKELYKIEFISALYLSPFNGGIYLFAAPIKEIWEVAHDNFVVFFIKSFMSAVGM